MANHKSALKRQRQSIKRRDRNRLVKVSVRTAIKRANKAIENGDKDAADAVNAAESVIAKAGTKGIYHQKTASRHISRLRQRLNKASA